MATIVITGFGTQTLLSDFPSTSVDLPIETAAQQIIMDQLANGDCTFLRIIGGAHYEVVRICENAGQLVLTRAQDGTEARDFTAGDCAIVYEETSSNPTGEPNLDCGIRSGTEDFLDITGNCTDGYVINFVGDLTDPNACTTPDFETINAGTRFLLDGCGYTNIDQICAALSSCAVGTGTQGPAGAPGQDGTDGIDGINGLNGIDGADGADGIDGINGINGADGAPGINGQDGLSAGSGIRVEVDQLGTVNHLPVPAGEPAAQVVGGINIDSLGHVIDGPSANFARWSGNLTGVQQYAFNMTSQVDPQQNFIGFQFTDPMPNAAYYISVVDDNAQPVPVTVTNKGALIFQLPYQNTNVHIYVHA